MIYFTAPTFKCVCHCRRAMFRVLGMYNFDENINHNGVKMILQDSKVHIFWEGHKILRNIHRRFDLNYYIGQIYGGDFAKFVAFSEYMKVLPKLCIRYTICSPGFSPILCPKI